MQARYMPASLSAAFTKAQLKSVYSPHHLGGFEQDYEAMFALMRYKGGNLLAAELTMCV
jgi:hypothetical protein